MIYICSVSIILNGHQIDDFGREIYLLAVVDLFPTTI